jgi:hypothetical protein
MYRKRLIQYKGMSLTEDTVEALKDLEERAWAKGGWRISYENPTLSRGNLRDLSLIPAGREVWMTLRHDRVETPRERALQALWGFAVPGGFTPLNRYPHEAAGDRVFHYFGPWQMVYDRLLAEGRGHLAWTSLCAAAQVDVGNWEGGKGEGRFIQAQLHRIGQNPGPVDGEIGPRTSRIIETLGIPRPTTAVVAKALVTAEAPKPGPGAVGKGQITIPGRGLGFHVFGAMALTHTPHGATLQINGPGRLVVDIGDPK